jgi:hypothetical protein
VTTGDDGATLHLRMQNETNLMVTLERSIDIKLPHSTETVRHIRFWADEPRAFMAEVRRHIG